LVSGLFNVGTGKARSFRDLIAAAYRTLGTSPKIDFIDMPPAIRDTYQYYTQSEGGQLLRAGYNGGFTPLEEAVSAYISGYLATSDRYR
jgi:ADP-L-glycero-D-manno-heptose 6-epimerase